MGLIRDQNLQLQMTWQPSLLTEKRKRGAPPLGLKNLGNSCYLNSVLQCLTYTPPLANFCLKLQHSSLCDSARDCPFCILEKRISRSLNADLTLDAPAKIQSCLRIFAEHFRCGRQEDAHEFLRYVIDACHNTCLRLKKLRRKGGSADPSSNGATSTSSVVREIFGGALQSQVKCLSCGSESNKVDEIMDISLDILHSSSLKDAMHKFFQPEVLDGNNKYKCDNCKKLVAARKQMSILQAPNILVIQLKRFGGIFGGKIDKTIAFEEVLVLSSFMCKSSQDPQPEYNLFGTIVHSGFSPDSGHYYAYIKDAMCRWYCCNDSSVSLSTLQEVMSEKVYILFFSRANQRPVSASNTIDSNGVKSHQNASNGVKSHQNASNGVKSHQHASNGVKPHQNGNELYNSVKASVPLKPVRTQPFAEQSSIKDVSTVAKVEKVPSNPRLKFNICGNSSHKVVLPTYNGKIDVHKNQKMQMNGDVKGSVHKDSNGKNTLAESNGLNKSERVDATYRDNGHAASPLANGNGNALSVGSNLVGSDSCSGQGRRCRITTASGVDHPKLFNGGLTDNSYISGPKRKSEDSCILLAQDAQSREKVEELKKVLEKEAVSVLQSCGWSERVYNYMSSRKRLCTREAVNTPCGMDLKKKMMADAKPTFISQIPESLKEDLIKQIRSFSKEKQEFPGP